MRTLKKTLCLVLALVLCLGLASVGFAGNFDGYTDADEVTYTEAVDYLLAAGIVEGDTATTINPKGNLTREQAAKLVAYAMLGATAADAMTASADPFDDVKATRWSAGYIAYCVNEGIIVGDGNGKFRPTDNVSGYEFAKMMLCAVGYGVNGEYEGTGWAVNVAKDALTLTVFANVLSCASNNAVNREEAFQMLFNTLTSVMTVSYNDAFKIYFSGNSPLVTVPEADEYKYTLGYTKYNLVKESSTDDYGNTAHYWAKATAPAKELTGKYTDDIVLGTVTATTTGGELYNNYKFEETVAVTVNGKDNGTLDKSNITRANKTAIFATAYSGATSIQLVDTDNDGEVNKVVVEYPYLAKVNSVKAATATEDAYVNLTVYTGSTGTSTVKVYTNGSFAKNDYVMIVPEDNTFVATTKALKLEKITPITSTISSYATAPVQSVTVNGGTYKASSTYSNTLGVAFDAVTNFKTVYNFYIYNDYVFGVTTAADVTALDFVYVVKSEATAAGGSLIGGASDALKVQVIYMDGTAAVLDYDLKVATTAIGDSISKGDTYYIAADGTPTKLAAGSPFSAGLYSYSIADGKITLSETVKTTVQPITEGKAMTDVNYTITVKRGNASIAGITGAYANSSTRLVLAKGASVTTYTGYANFPVNAEYKVEEGKISAIVYITKGSTITDILVVGAEAVDTTAVYGVYAGAGNVTAEGTEYRFFVDGQLVSYIGNATVCSSLNAKDIVSIDVDADNKLSSATKVVSSIETGKTVSGIDADYIIVDGAPVYKNAACQVFDISATPAAEWISADVAMGDTVSYITRTNAATSVSEIIYIFITGHAE